MTARERFQRIMRYESVDRLPLLAVEPFETRVVEDWRRQGLPADVSPEEFLGMDRVDSPPVTFFPIPPFEHRVISEDDEYIVETGEMNAVVRRRKEAPGTFFGLVDYPVKTRADWEQYKERFRASSPGRVSDKWGDEEVRRLDASDRPVTLCIYPFFFRLGFYTLGMERFMTAFHEEPDLIHDMFSFWADFVAETIRPVISRVTPDYVTIAEDLAYKTAPHISPKTYREFFLPYQDPIIELLRENGVAMITLWSSGNFDVLLPTLLEHGFNATLPIERAAGMDAIALRKRYGRELLLVGNISIEALIAGPEAIDREIERLTPLIREGGFLPTLDDIVPLETPFAHYRHLIDRLRSMRLST